MEAMISRLFIYPHRYGGVVIPDVEQLE